MEDLDAVNPRVTKALLAALLAAFTIGAGRSADRGADWVDKRVAALQPTADERRIDRIGWAADLRSALRLARQHNRPVFLFTVDGRFSIGRC